jgi:hypothetical protein
MTALGSSRVQVPVVVMVQVPETLIWLAVGAIVMLVTVPPPPPPPPHAAPESSICVTEAHSAQCPMVIVPRPEMVPPVADPCAIAPTEARAIKTRSSAHFRMA